MYSEGTITIDDTQTATAIAQLTSDLVAIYAVTPSLKIHTLRKI